jgi:chromosomal replication initiation ATPase DnaA
LCVELIRELTKPRASYPTIGREMGGRRHHAMIMALERRAHDLIDAFPHLYDRRQSVLRRLGLNAGSPHDLYEIVR